MGLFGVVLVLSYGWLGAFVVLFYGSFSIVTMCWFRVCSVSVLVFGASLSLFKRLHLRTEVATDVPKPIADW